MRGEDDQDTRNAAIEAGSPPHARGRPGIFYAVVTAGGITPACAGKTSANSTR